MESINLHYDVSGVDFAPEFIKKLINPEPSPA